MWIQIHIWKANTFSVSFFHLFNLIPRFSILDFTSSSVIDFNSRSMVVREDAGILISTGLVKASDPLLHPTNESNAQPLPLSSALYRRSRVQECCLCRSSQWGTMSDRFRVNHDWCEKVPKRKRWKIYRECMKIKLKVYSHCEMMVKCSYMSVCLKYAW